MGKLNSKKGSLATRVALVTTSLVLLAVTSVSWLGLRREQENFQEELEQQAEILLNTLEVTTADALYLLDASFIEQLMEPLGEEKVLTAGRVYDKEGRVVADAYGSNVLAYSTVPDPLGKKLVLSNETIFQWQKDQLLAGKAVIVGNQRLGAVSVGLSTAPLQTKIAAARNQGLLVAIIATSTGTILALLLSRSITKPLQKLTIATKNLAEGKLDQKIEIGANDELSLLADTFNGMTGQIQQLITNLEQRAEDLRKSEALVREKAQQEVLFNKLGNQISNSLELKTILATAVQSISSLLKIDCCQFLWYSSEPFPNWNCVEEFKKSSRPSDLGQHPFESNDFWSQQLLNLEIIRVADNRSGTDSQIYQLNSFWKSRAILAVPITTRNNAIGVVCCRQYDSPRRWQDSEVELLSSVCGQLAIAVSQAGLFQEANSAAALAKEKASQLEQALETLQRTQSQLIQSEKIASMGRLLSGVAYAINRPFNSIERSTSLVEKYIKDLLSLLDMYSHYYPSPVTEISKSTEYMSVIFFRKNLPKQLGIIQSGVEHLNEIAKSLHNWSRPDENQLKVVDIHEEIDSTLVLLENSLQAKQNYSAIEFIKLYSQLPKFECYPGEFKQALMNILTNAVEACDQHNLKVNLEATLPQSAKIWIRTTRQESGAIAISIRDNGTGVTPWVEQHLFDPFFSTKSTTQNIGLGLSVSYQIIVERHGGKLSCVSSGEQGTEFVIELPPQASQLKNQ